MTEINVGGPLAVSRAGRIALRTGRKGFFSAGTLVSGYGVAFIAALLAIAKVFEEQINFLVKDICEATRTEDIPSARYKVFRYRLRACFVIRCILLVFVVLREVAVDAATEYEGDAAATPLDNVRPAQHFQENHVSSESVKRHTLDEPDDNGAVLGPPSLLQGENLLPTARDGYVHLAVCDSGIFLESHATVQVQVVVPESRNCWQLCRFLEDKYYDLCESKESPEECFKQQFAEDTSVPRRYQSACTFEDPRIVCPLFSRTAPASNFCLQGGMELWLRTGTWTSLVHYKPTDCDYVKWEPGVAEKAFPSAFIEDTRSLWASMLNVARFTDFYVLSRDVDILLAAEDVSVPLLEIESTIVPALYWDTKKEKGAWEVVAKFAAPDGHDWFDGLTRGYDGVSTAADICLFETARGPGLESKFGMLPGQDACDGQIGVLRVAALSGVPSAASIDRETGFNLCVARRWVQRGPRYGMDSVSRVEVMQRVILDSNCASALSPLKHQILTPNIAGEWEQHFLALLYPLTKGISGMKDTANCPWDMSIQYGLKCFTAVEVNSSAYMASFPESQTACRRLALGHGVPTSFSRLAVVQNDHDFKLLSFISPPGSTAWIGFSQHSQVQLSTISPEAAELRIPETPCPEEVLTSAGKSFSRMSTLKALCEAHGSRIDYPSWESTWPENDGDLSTLERWDIPWCPGHPKVEAEGRYVDCAALKTIKDGTSCVSSVACDTSLTSFCSFPVYYPPGVVGYSREHRRLHLSPRVPCTHAACVVRLNLLAEKASSARLTEHFLGVPSPNEAFIAIKSTCLSTKSMIGPYPLADEVVLTSQEAFQRLKAGLYDLCYCTLLPRVKGQGNGERCRSPSEYRQLLATLVLQEDRRTDAMEGALQIPSIVLRPLSSQAFAIDTGRSKMLTSTIVSCAWLATNPSEVCTFYLKEGSSADRRLSSQFTLHIIPLDSKVDEERVCSGRFEARIMGDLSVDSAVSVLLTHPTTAFYAVCEESGGRLGSLFFSEFVALPKRPEATMQLRFPSHSVKEPEVQLTVKNPYVDGVGRISSVVVIPARGGEDMNCSWEVTQNSDERQEYRDATASGDGSVSYTLTPRVGFGKICYVIEEPTTGDGGSRFSGYIDFLPPASNMRRLVTTNSRCFAEPNNAPCSFDAFPEPLPEHDNPHSLWEGCTGLVRLCTDEGVTGGELIAAVKRTAQTTSAYILHKANTYDSENNKVFCYEGEPGGCVVSVRGVNMNLFDSASNRLTSFDSCQAPREGIGFLSVYGKYYNNPLIGEQAFASTEVVDTASSPVAPGNTRSAVSADDSHTHVDYMDFSRVMSTELSSAFNATLLNYHCDFYTAYSVLELCFDGSRMIDSEAEMPSRPKVGYLVFALHLSKAELTVTESGHIAGRTYDVTVSVKGSHKQALQDNSVVYTKIPSSDQSTATTCDYAVDKSTTLIHEKSPAEVTVVDDSDTHAVYWHAQANQPVAFCWSLSFSNSSGIRTAWQNALLGYSFGPSLPDLGSDIPFCSLESFSQGCSFTLQPSMRSMDRTGGYFSEASVYLSDAGVVAMLKDPGAFCPESFDSSVFSEQADAAYVLEKISSNSSSQELSVPRTGLDLLVRTGKAVLCYAIRDCGPVAEGVQCAKDLGFLRWLGPVQQPAGWLAVCEQLEQSDCIVTVDGFGLEMLDYSTPLLAVKQSCAATTILQTGHLVTKSNSESLKSQSPSLPKKSALQSRQSEDASTEAVNSTSLEFAVAYMPASVGVLCWSIQKKLGKGGANATDYSFYLGRVVFLPLPVIVASEFRTDTAKGTKLYIRINVLLDVADVEALLKPPGVENADDHYLYQVVADSKSCAEHTTEEARLSFVHSNSRLVDVASRIEITETTQTSDKSVKQNLSGSIRALDLDYEVSPSSRDTHLCWRSVFHDESGEKVYDYITHVESIAGASVAELDQTAVNHPAPAVALCSHVDDENDCTVTIKPHSSGPSRFLPPASQVFLLSGSVTCPDEVDNELFTMAEDGSNSQILESAASVKLRAREWNVQDGTVTFAYPSTDKSWISINGMASICWTYGTRKDECPAVGDRQCVVNLGTMYWRGVRRGVKPLVLMCENAAGCEVEVDGTNLHTLDHSYSRVALLNECGHGGGRGLLDVTGYPEGYRQSKVPSPPLSNYFAEEGAIAEGRYFVYADSAVELACEGGTTVVVLDAYWQMDKQAPGTICPDVDVLGQLVDWCQGRQQCIVHPYVAGGEHSGATLESREGGLPFSAPCSAGEDPVLYGTYMCTSGTSGEAALVEEHERTASPPRNFSGTLSNALQRMTFAVVRAGPRMYRICWNPREELVLAPEAYIVDLGIVQILPTAGILDIRRIAATPVDAATLEIYVTSMLDEESAKDTTIYVVPPSGGNECDAGSMRNETRVGGYVARSADLSILTYTLEAPDSEVVACWNWMGENLVNAAGFKQQNRLGVVPGASNPEFVEWGTQLCGGDPDTVCEISLRPAVVESASAFSTSEDEHQSKSPVKSTHLAPFFQRKYSVFLIGSKAVCPSDPSDPVYTAPGKEMNSFKLSRSRSTGTEVFVALNRAEKEWLAAQHDGLLCWVNDGTCGSSGMKQCVAAAGIVSWIGPIPVDWDPDPLNVRCKKDIPCEIAVKGPNLSLMNSAISRVAVLEKCGAVGGPGIATDKYKTDTYAAGNASGSPSMLQRSPIMTGSARLHALPFSSGGSSSMCSDQSACEDPSFTQQMVPSSLEAEARAFPHVSKTDVLLVETIITEARNYLICWNPGSTVSGDLSMYSVRIGLVEFYGFQMTRAMCISGSTCALTLSAVGVNMSDVEVALKAVDCSDLTLTTDLGDGILYHKTDDLFELASRIPEGPAALKTYHMCWCDKRARTKCAPTDYADQIGVLLVRVMPFIDAVCSFVEDRCSIGIPKVLLTEDSYGWVSIVEDTAGTRDCDGGGKVTNFGLTFSKTLMTVTIDVPNHGGEDAVSLTTLLICWHSSKVPLPMNLHDVTHFSSKASLLGTIRFAGPLMLDKQASGMMAPVGLSLHVKLEVAGFNQLLGTPIDTSASQSSIHPQWRRLYVVPKDKCGQRGEFVHWLQLKSVIPGSYAQLAVYEDTEVLRIPPNGIDTLDACWCTHHSSCSRDEQYSVKVAELGVLSPQANVHVQCSYDTRCPFHYENLAVEAIFGLDSRLIVADPGCAATAIDLPERGVLARKRNGATLTDLEQSRHVKETHEFASPIERSAIFPWSEKKYTFAVCYCAIASACEVELLVEVGTLLVHDVWAGTLVKNPLQPLDIYVPDPPFSGTFGRLYISNVDGTSERETGIQQAGDRHHFVVDLGVLLDEASPPRSVLILYCEKEVAAYCSLKTSERIKLAEVQLEGSAEKSWVGLCALGSKCELKLRIFRGESEIRERTIAMLSNCSKPRNTLEYGLSNVGVVLSSAASVAEMKFTWERELQDTGHSSYQACWCDGTTEGDCAGIQEFSTQIGTVNVTGLRGYQSGHCRVGTVCTADNLKGYNLSAAGALKVLAHSCGEAGTEILFLPRLGLFEAYDVTDATSSFTLGEKLLAVHSESIYGRLCQCPRVHGDCTSADEFTWDVGEYSFSGPSEVVVVLNAATGVPPEFTLAFTGVLQLSRDFIKLGLHKDCTHTTAFDPPLPYEGWLPMNSTGSIDSTRFQLALRGNVYFVCYCHASALELPQEAGNNPFHAEAAEPDENQCNVASAYRTLVGVLVVTGPYEVDNIYTCVSGRRCQVDVVSVLSGSEDSNRWIASSVLELKEDTCDDNVLASGTVQEWVVEKDYVVDYGNVTLKSARQTFAFPAHLRLMAGRYVVCWRASGDVGRSLEVGRMQVKGPRGRHEVMEVWSGVEFTLDVDYFGSEGATALTDARLRLVPYPDGITPPRAINCEAEPWSVGETAAFRYLDVNRSPDIVSATTETFYRALWYNVVVAIDAKSPEFSPGAFFAVCYCDGHASDCALESSFFAQVTALQVLGPTSNSLNYTVQLGRSIRYTLKGFRLPIENYLMILPPKDPVTNQSYSCGQAGTEKLFPVSMTVTEAQEDTEKAIFKNLIISIPSPTVTVCWCGGPECSAGSSFRVEIGTIPVDYPQMEKVTIIPEGIFSVILTGSSLHLTDRVTIIGPDNVCGHAGTDKIDSRLITIPHSSSVTELDDLGKGQLIKDMPPLDGRSRWLWSSWPMQATPEVSKALKVCYCSSNDGSCSGLHRFSSWVGSVAVLGPHRGSLAFHGLSYSTQELELKGNSLSIANRLKYFVTFRSADATTGDMRRLCSLTPDTEATIAVPDRVSEDGTEQHFAVSMAPGYRYIICWSFGHTPIASVEEEAAPASTPETDLPAKAPRSDTAASTQSISSEDNLNQNQPTDFMTTDAGTATAYSHAELSAPPSDAKHSPSLTTSTSRLYWNFLAEFQPTGFRVGQVFTAVVNMEDYLVVRGSGNTTDAYAAYVGVEGRGRDCEELRARQTFIIKEPAEVTEQHMLFSLPAFVSTGSYPFCILNVKSDTFYDVGIIRVEKFYWKSVYDVLARSRLIMFPCYATASLAISTEARSGSGGGGRLYMPDGMGAWTATLGFIDSATEKAIPILKFEGENKGWIDFYEQGVRSIVSCAADHKEAIYFLGPSRLLVVPPESAAAPDAATATYSILNHELPTPVDVSASYPYVFISDYQSPMILVLSASDSSFRWRLFPTNPVLLFAAGVQVLETENQKVTIAVADLINHIVGLIHVNTETMQKGAQNDVLSKPWDSYFGRPKVALHNSQGLSYPFTLSRYAPVASAVVLAERQTSSLLMVGELVSERIVFLEPHSSGLHFYRQIELPERLMLTGLQMIQDNMFLASRDWFKDVEQVDSHSYISIMKLADLVESRYFTYPEFRVKVQSGLRYSFTPVVSGPPIQFFREDKANSNLTEMGLHLDEKTGVISGIVSHTGTFNVAIVGGDLLGSYTWTLTGEAGCRAGDYYNAEHAACEPCPVGTFRDQEADLQYCETHKPNSSTLSVGSTQLAQCQCNAGFEIGSLGTCIPCPEGTYKATISDSNCTGKCPTNMRSVVVGAASEEQLECVCDAGYFMEDGTCKPCPVGSYCTGDLSMPVTCPENRTTKSSAAYSPHKCKCVPGYTLQGNDCVTCSRLTYKSAVGNEACTACPQPASLADSTVVLASTKRDVAEYTSERGATQLQECRLCASGYFFDTASGGCIPCSKNYFCPGRDVAPTSCAENSLTVYEGAETPFACTCPKGYGKISERNPVDLTILCGECPRNTFQHMDGVDTECLPCPSATFTKTTKSTTITACVASPGYFFPEKLEQILSGVSTAMQSVKTEDDDTEGVVATASVRQTEGRRGVVDFSAIRSAEVKYELMSEDLVGVPSVCLPGLPLVEQSSPEIKMQTYTVSLQKCIVACTRNLYCTSLTYRRGRPADPSFATVVSNYTGVYVVSHWPCELHFYGKELSNDEIEVLQSRSYHTTAEEGITSCIIQREESDTLWRRLVYQECPMNAYCPGDTEAQIYECPPSSVTLAPRASSVEQCNCIPGYRSVGGQCEPCAVGTYKNTTSNMSCTQCPSSFTTAGVASISAYDCVCLPGLYMKRLDEEEEAEDVQESPAEEAHKEAWDDEKIPGPLPALPEPPLPSRVDEEQEDEGDEEEEEEEDEDVNEDEHIDGEAGAMLGPAQSSELDHGEKSTGTKEGRERTENTESDEISQDDEEASSGGADWLHEGRVGVSDGAPVEEAEEESDGSETAGPHDEGEKREDALEEMPAEPDAPPVTSAPDSPNRDAAASSLLDMAAQGQRKIRRKSSRRRTATGFPHNSSPKKGRHVSIETNMSSAVELHGKLLIRADRGELSVANIKQAAGRGGLGGTIFIPEKGGSLLEWAKPKWLEEEVRQKLEKVVRLHHCSACYKQMYCPGLWLDPPFNHTHMPPQLCPEGSNVPSSTVTADSVEKCLCLPGYSYTVGGTEDKDIIMGCSKCAPGTYKELQENSPCAGRCMKDAETFEGAVSKMQCFCKVGKYAVESTGTDYMFTCQDCVEGGVCPGGFKESVRVRIEADPNFANITINDHQVPFPSRGYFAVYKNLDDSIWDPRLIPTNASFTDDKLITSEDREPELVGQYSEDSSRSADVVTGSRQVKTLHFASEPYITMSGGSTTQHGSAYEAHTGGQLPSGMLQTGLKHADQPENPASSVHYERIPDIHPCFDDVRCEGGPHNTCSPGSTGYLCSACEPGYSTPWYRSMCKACLPIWVEFLLFLSLRLAVCLVFWLLASISIIAAEQRDLVHPILFRILLSNYFAFSAFGLMPDTSVSTLSEWAPLYRAYFFTGYFSAHAYVKLACITRAFNMSIDYRHAWYVQRVLQIIVPLFDAVLLTLLSMAAVSIYKVLMTRRIERIRAVLAVAQETRGGEFWTDCTIRKIENNRCLGLFRYLTSFSVFSWTGFKNILTDLIPAYTIIWFWHYPASIIQYSELINCVSTRYKSEPPLYVLTAMPIQRCKLDDTLFLKGFILGLSGILLWGVGTVVLLVLYIQRSRDAEPVQIRYRRSFLTNGYQVQYRAWEAVLTARKGALALIMAVNIHLHSAGAQEVFRSSSNLAISIVYVMMQLIMEPYDRRSHNLANRVEFYGLLSHVVNGVIIQGSYYFDTFKYLGPIPIVIATCFYLYVIWHLFVEWGRTVMMRPYLARVPSFWRYYNRVTRALARLYAAGNAKIYYNYITKDMVVEAATKLRVFHIRRLLKRRKYQSTYRKINYENRLYFVAALTDSLSQLVVAWCQFTIPGDWLDFTIRYAFCYCFWQRHHGAMTVRIPLDYEEFESIKPDLFSDWYHQQVASENVDADETMFEQQEYVCNQAEEELLQLMLDDDVYDDSPITLMELYVAVLSMRFIPQAQLRRLHFWYRERIANASNPVVLETRKENEQLMKEIEELNETLREMSGTQAVSETPSFSLMDFFFTVEMVQQAQLEVARLKEQIEKVTEEIARDRVAQAMATHMMIGLQQEEEVQAKKKEAGEAMEELGELPSLPVARRPEEADSQLPQPPMKETAVREKKRMEYFPPTTIRRLFPEEKDSAKKKLKLADRRIERTDTRRTLQRSFTARRTLVGVAHGQGGVLTLRRPGLGGESPSRRIAIGGDAPKRSLAPLQATKAPGKSISIARDVSQVPQIYGEGPLPLPSEEGAEKPLEKRRRTLSRFHMKDRRCSGVTLLREGDKRRTIRLGSINGVRSSRTLSRTTWGASGSLSDTGLACSEGSTATGPSVEIASGSASKGRVAKKTHSLRDPNGGMKRRLSPVQQTDGLTSPQKPDECFGGDATGAELDTERAPVSQKPVARGRSVASPKAKPRDSGALASPLHTQRRQPRTFSPLAADAPSSARVPGLADEPLRRSLASPTLSSESHTEREARTRPESSVSSGPRRLSSPIASRQEAGAVRRRDEETGGDAPRVAGIGEATTHAEGDSDERRQSESSIGRSSQHSRERSANNQSAKSGVSHRKGTRRAPSEGP